MKAGVELKRTVTVIHSTCYTRPGDHRSLNLPARATGASAVSFVRAQRPARDNGTAKQGFTTLSIPTICTPEVCVCWELRRLW